MANVLTEETMQRLLPIRPADGHKGTFGHVGLLAGSMHYCGAARLAAEGALRSGAGLVSVGVPAPLAPILAATALEMILHGLPATPTGSFDVAALEPALAFAQSKEAVVLGPGLSQDPATQEFVCGVVRTCPVPMVVDADGLNGLCRDLTALRGAAGGRLLTPHPGEMARLTRSTSSDVQIDREHHARAFAMEHGCVVVLKGNQTLIAHADGEVWVNPTGNAGLGSGGTGDVLAGLIGGLLAQGMPMKDAACVGVYIHGLAGDIAAARMTQRGMLARDVANALPEAWKIIESGRP